MTRRIEVLKTGKVGVAFCTDWREHHYYKCKDSPNCNVIGKDKMKREERVKDIAGYLHGQTLSCTD